MSASTAVAWHGLSGRMLVCLGAVLALGSCGGGGGGSTGTERDSGPDKTTLTVEARDADGDALQYQWRVTAGTIENRNARSTVWTMPAGPGLHFAYVLVSDGKGGYVEQQYAVGTDALNVDAPSRPAVQHTAPAVTDFEGAPARLRIIAGTQVFAGTGLPAARSRSIFLPDVRVEVVSSTGEVVFAGLSDLAGDVSLPKLRMNERYVVRCSRQGESAWQDCRAIELTGGAQRLDAFPQTPDARNLRLFGHVALSDGGVCGTENAFFDRQSAATVTLLQEDGTALGSAVRVNRFGDYHLAQSVPVKAALRLKVRCEGYEAVVNVPASSDPAGYFSHAPVEVSHTIPGARPSIVRVVANGPDGNIRGKMILPQAGDANAQPGGFQFLTYKGADTPLSACMYYRSLGATKSCDAQGRMVEPISFEDWKRKHRFGPHRGANTEVEATYINEMDLNLVRRMVATQVSSDHIAFYVCNHPGPEGKGQQEVDSVIDTGLNNEKLVACVAMEWSTSPGVNGGKPFTKFFTFGPDGSLLPSINLDFRGEKYMPGACVACHGGGQYNGRFGEKGNPSPFLGSSFLPFDTANFRFSSKGEMGEAAQSASLHKLNQLVRATEASDDTPISTLVKGWYHGGSTTLDKAYVPPAWRQADGEPGKQGAARLYREVIGASCRTCHSSLPAYNWDAIVLDPGRAARHFCGGSADVAINASMPNAVVSRDRLGERADADPALAELMTRFLGCSKPLSDPVYGKR